MRFKPPTMLRKHRVRSLLLAGTVLVAVSGTALAQTSGPAKADPQTTLVVVGSDTIQDVWNGFTNGSPASTGFAAVPAALGAGTAASYNATNPATGNFHETITPQDGWALQNGIVPNPSAAFPLSPGNCSYARPNGSSEGRDSLRLALNANSTNAKKAFAPVAPLGCVDIARSSSGVDITDNVPAVDIQWVPFAIDAVTVATGPSSCSPTTNCPGFTADLGNGSTKNVTTVASTLGSAIGTMTVAQLSSLYNCNAVPVTVGGTTTTYIGTVIGQSVPTGDVGVDLYVPQAGSGTRSFWEGGSAASFLDSTVDSAGGCVHDFIVNGALANGQPGVTANVPVEEHDGTAVSTDPIGLDPFSIAQWISQQNPSHNPRFHGAVLQGVTVSGTVVPPFTVSGTTDSLNTAFPILRYVYDIVKLSRLTAAGDPIGTLLNGVGSTICHAHSLIQGYGFALMSTTVFQGVACGAILTTNEGAP
jgi:hypothetical protein